MTVYNIKSITNLTVDFEARTFGQGRGMAGNGKLDAILLLLQSNTNNK